jgi:CheY-like chemotaxis protein
MSNSCINILIADDDTDDALLLTEALHDNLPSCKCIHASDGIAALNCIATEVNPDIVFLDLNMPLKDGINCLKDIHNNNLLPTTPIIICSTSSNINDIKACEEYGASFYIIKPASFIEFNKIITQAISLLGKPKSERLKKSDFVLREKNNYYSRNLN